MSKCQDDELRDLVLAARAVLKYKGYPDAWMMEREKAIFDLLNENLKPFEDIK